MFVCKTPYAFLEKGIFVCKILSGFPELRLLVYRRRHTFPKKWLFAWRRLDTFSRTWRLACRAVHTFPAKNLFICRTTSYFFPRKWMFLCRGFNTYHGKKCMHNTSYISRKRIFACETLYISHLYWLQKVWKILFLYFANHSLSLGIYLIFNKILKYKKRSTSLNDC